MQTLLSFLVGPGGFEPTTNGLKVLNSVSLFATFSTFFSVAKKWCASFSIVPTAIKLSTVLAGILTMPAIHATITFASTTFFATNPAILR